MTTTFERVRSVIAEVMNISPERVEPDTHVTNELGPDSLEQVEIVMGLESEFGLDLKDDPQEFGAVSDIVSNIEKEISDRELQYDCCR